MPTPQEALNQAVALHQSGRLAHAAQIYQQVLQVEPRNLHATHLLGLVAHQTGQQETAVNLIGQAIAIDPSHSFMHNNLGGALRAMGQFDAAERSCREALRLEPDYVEAHNNLGLVLREKGDNAGAAAAYREALQRRPDMADAQLNLSVALGDLGQIHESIAAAEAALQLTPNLVDALVQLSLLYTDLGRLDEAIALCDRALAQKSDSAEAHSSRALARLSKGDFAQGLPEYEWRWKTKTMIPRAMFAPRWDGSPLAGRTILLHVEQGKGDILQFIRYAPLVKATGGRVVVECDQEMQPLLASCAGIDSFIAPGELLPRIDVHAPLLSVPGLVRTTLSTIPAKTPYLQANPASVENWRRKLADLPGFKIGIAWQGSSAFRGDRWRSMPLELFEPLAKVPGVQLVSLQKGDGAEQIAQVQNQFTVLELPGLDDAGGAFMDTAALMHNLDLVVTSDTSIAHLAGALARPVWVALPVAADWRWLRDRSDSPWYPTMRLFRQTELGNWPPVFAEIAGEMQKAVNSRS